MSHDDERSPSEDEAPVQSLIQGREKRSTAGRQMSALLDAEADDELALLFEEVDDDNEFAADAAEEGGEEDDMGLDSSSDDEDDQGPSAQADDLEGERQIEKEEKEEKKKKRAREDLRYRITSKKVKVDPTAAPKAPTTPAPRPRKKSERVSWIPTLDEGPTRSSSRRQTMQNKELTHARLKDSEEKRIRLIATMEEAAKRKAKHKPKKMTQAEHLAEAERVERHNSKSLNRWEEMEKRKAEERRAKIEALQNRRLEGPVISYWSGVATWADGRLARVGKVAITPKPEKDDSGRKKSKKADKEGKPEIEQKPGINTEPSTSLGVPVTPSENPAPPTTEPKQDQQLLPTQPAGDASQATTASQIITTTSDTEIQGTQGETSKTPQAAVPPNEVPGAPTSAAPSAPLEPDTAPSTIKPTLEATEATQAAGEQSAKVNSEGTTQETLDRPTSHNPTPNSPPKAPEAITTNSTYLPKAEEKANDVMQQPTNEPSPTTQLDPERTPAVSTPHTLVTIQPTDQGSAEGLMELGQKPEIHVDETNTTTADSQPVAPPAVIEHTGRCLTVLENFDDKTAQSRDFSIYFNAKKPPRLTKISSSLCVITSLPSRYRDPDTSLPFANSYAYHEIRHTAAQKYSWSPMLGCYVGPAGIAARGVPDRFLDPNAEETTKRPSGAGNQSSVPDKENAAKPAGDAAPTTATAAEPSMPAVATAPPPPLPPASAPAPAPVQTATAPSAPIPTTAGAGDAMDID
ncbi:YL1 nuclear protein-domain-containing protein, partial [Aspergillus multicolor]|uniref:putative signal transducer n=1 Tax=Aspergillus multicolor TaxID=41759 RepID=UPI003CCDB67A